MAYRRGKNEELHVVNLSSKYKEHPLRNGLLPALFAAITVSAIYYIFISGGFDKLYGAGSSEVIFASFAASVFILFMMPRSRAARVPKFAKSYFMAAIIGYLGFLLSMHIPTAIAIGITIFVLIVLLVATKSEHPPAVGIAFAFVIYRVGFYGVFEVIAILIAIIGIRILLEESVFAIKDLEKFDAQIMHGLKGKSMERSKNGKFVKNKKGKGGDKKGS